MINNRQNGRRGRGRNGVRPQGGGGPRTDQGNRIDNRSRGNASQLHEKYKTLARDAQMQGDRVMTEYYLQFADHYFRVLSEGQRRFEEQRPPRQDGYGQVYQDEGDDADEASGDEGYDEPRAAPPPRRDDGRPQGGTRYDNRPNERAFEARREDGRRDEARREEVRRDDGRRDDNRRDDRYAQDRAPRQDRGERPERIERQPRPVADERGYEPRANEARAEPAPPAAAPREPELGLQPGEAPRPRRGRPPKPRPDAAAGGANGHAAEPAERFDMAVLPPSIAPVPGDAVAEEAPRRRRTRRLRIEPGENDASGDVAA